MSSAPSLGIVHYSRQQTADALFAAFAREAAAAGLRLAGCVQINGEKRCADKAMALEDLTSGHRINICQDLGPGAGAACRIDPEAVSAMAGLLRAGLAAAPDLVIINKFGKLESEGGGLLDEIGAAIAAGHPVLIGVSDKFHAEWEAYAQGLGAPVDGSLAALRLWLKAVLPR